ncbi:MAG: DNA repair protein RadA [Alphaproteobacteria bacterium]|nr:DNA repair protein RadA [Alphaproteobacteria bacterium]
MAKSHATYACQACGAVTGRWSGKCESCGAWNSIAEEVSAASKGTRSRGKGIELYPLAGASQPVPRLLTGINEFDRVTGGGMAPGSALLVGGDPGIGKSTLMLAAAAGAARSGAACLYITGEEAIDQIRARALRLGIADSALALASATEVGEILATLDRAGAADLVVIDSIQTMQVAAVESAAGSVAQLRAAAQELIALGKRRNMTLLLVGHVTKDGMIAGPKLLEHMVDTVLYFEGERGHHYRILRAVKNRYGPADEIGVFEMTDRGLIEVANPSALFLANRGGAAGTSVFAGIEGTRPLLVEVQALVSPSPLGTPRRAVVGWDTARLAMVLAVLEARGGVAFAGRDVYLNIAGGLRIGEPAADLAVAAALLSAYSGRPMDPDTVVFGEIGLSGEVREVSQLLPRLKEAAKLGFRAALTPAEGGRGAAAPSSKSGAGITVESIAHVGELVERLDALRPITATRRREGAA